MIYSHAKALCHVLVSKKKKLRKEHDIQTAVIDNFKIIDQCDRWSQLLVLEAFYINQD